MCCFHKNGSPVSVGDDQYYKLCVETERWFDQDFIRSHAVLANHKSHDPRFLVLNIATPRQDILADQCKSLRDEVTDLVSIFYGSDHYCVCHVNIKKRLMYVYDGLNYSLATWKSHCVSLLKRCKLLQLDSTGEFDWTTGKKSMMFYDESGNWVMRPGQQVHQQTNLVDCGPLACLQIMRLFGRVADTAKLKDLTTQQLRSLVVADYKSLLKECDGNIRFVVQKTTKKKTTRLYTTPNIEKLTAGIEQSKPSELKGSPVKKRKESPVEITRREATGKKENGKTSKK